MDSKYRIYSQRIRPTAKLFHYTPAEERAMARAVQKSIIFMENYGKGCEPYMVDLRYYESAAKHKK